MKNSRVAIQVFLIAAVCLFWSLPLRGDDQRILADAKINGKPVKLAFDTGSDISWLLRSTAESLGLHVTNWPAGKKVAPGKTPYGQAESCELTISGMTKTFHFGVVDVSAAIRFDVEGMLGWPTVSQSIMRFDCLNENCQMLDSVPENVSQWTKLNLRRNFEILALEVPDKVFGKGTLIVDTGSDHGVSLAPRLWKDWTAKHPNRNKTIEAVYNPTAGLVTQEVAWADELSFGPLILHDVPVRQAHSAEIALDSSNLQATFGLTALKRLILVVDGKKGAAYLQPRTSPPLPYEHNRIGAVFVPEDLEKSEYLTARVLPGSPAYDANVRDADVLLKIDDLDVTQWRTDPNVQPLSRFWERPAGTKVRLTLKRGDKEFQTEIVLRDLIGPDVTAKHLNEPPR